MNSEIHSNSRKEKLYVETGNPYKKSHVVIKLKIKIRNCFNRPILAGFPSRFRIEQKYFWKGNRGQEKK